MIHVGILIADLFEHLKIFDAIRIGKNQYSVCQIDYKNENIGVRKVKIDPEGDVEEGDYFKCPYCGHINYDACEYDDSDEELCGKCGSEIRHIRTRKGSYIVQGIKCKKFTKITIK